MQVRGKGHFGCVVRYECGIDGHVYVLSNMGLLVVLRQPMKYVHTFRGSDLVHLSSLVGKAGISTLIE